MTSEILQTGSSGNCVILNGVIALDMGVAYKKVAPHVRGLQLVFVSHEHGDHFKPSTIRALVAERPTLRFCACEPPEESEKVGWKKKFMEADVSERNIDIMAVGKRYNYGAFQIEPMTLYHDVPNFGLKIFAGGEKAIYIVDTGYVDDVEADGYDLYLLEANHTTAEIKARISEKQARGEFAYEVRAARNHLSKEQAMEWLARNAGPNSKYVFLHQHRGERNKDG